MGNSTQDTMGFTVVGPDRFLGSGHPGELESGPPLLGLIASTDAAGSWTPISLSGQADFHVLRSAPGRVYGVDSSTGRLMSSSDEGATWIERESPAPLLDLAPDPEDPDHVVASGEGGLYESSDGGANWSELGEEIGFLSWPMAGTLFLLDLDGKVLVSTDGGSSWEPRGEISGPPVAFLAPSDKELYAALGDGTVVASSDGGRSFDSRASQ